MESGKETANVYRNREFRIYLATRFLMTFGIQMQNVITGWYLYELTKDPLILGMVGLSEALPALSSALFAGDLVDKFDKRKVLIIAFSVYLVCGIGFTFLGTQYAASLSHQLVVWGFYGHFDVAGAGKGFRDSGILFHPILSVPSRNASKGSSGKQYCLAGWCHPWSRYRRLRICTH